MLKLTKSGMDLLLRAMTGEAKINFDSIQIGNGSNAGSSATELSNPILTADITACEIGDIFVTLKAIYSNADVPAGFKATELGVLANDPDNEGGMLLYAYEYTLEAQADYIPSSADKLLETQMDVLIYIGEAQNVTASISQSLVYAGKEELETHIKDKRNPHGVDKVAVGLGNVPNVTTNDQTPTYTEAKTMAALKSGEKLSLAIGKLAKAVSSLISHIGTTGKNVHSETPESIGAAPTSHKHSTTDITSGILGLARGGTGVTTYAALRKAIDAGSASDVDSALQQCADLKSYAFELACKSMGMYGGLSETITALNVDLGEKVYADTGATYTATVAFPLSSLPEKAKVCRLNSLQIRVGRTLSDSSNSGRYKINLGVYINDTKIDYAYPEFTETSTIFDNEQQFDFSEVVNNNLVAIFGRPLNVDDTINIRFDMVKSGGYGWMVLSLYNCIASVSYLLDGTGDESGGDITDTPTTQVTFTIDGTQYSCASGYTWLDFANDGGAGIITFDHDGFVQVDTGYLCLGDLTQPESGDEIIRAGAYTGKDIVMS